MTIDLEAVSATAPDAAVVARLVGVSCDFSVRLPGRGRGTVHAVDNVNLAVERGKTLGLVGWLACCCV